MSTALYDTALVNKIKGWINETQLQVYGPNETSRMFEVMADTSDDSPIKLPFISISRDRGFKIINEGTTRRPLSYDGATIGVDETGAYSKVLNAIPISIEYQIDVYTRYAEEADILIRNLIFNFVNYPTLSIDIPKVDTFNHTARITLGDSITDNSDIKERFVTGNLTRLSLNISIDDAYLWDVRKLHNVDIDLVYYDIHHEMYGDEREQ